MNLIVIGEYTYVSWFVCLLSQKLNLVELSKILISNLTYVHVHVVNTYKA